MLLKFCTLDPCLTLSLPIVSTTAKIRDYLWPVISAELRIFRTSRYYRWKGHKILKKVGWFSVPSLLARDVDQKIVNFFLKKWKTSGKEGVNDVCYWFFLQKNELNYLRNWTSFE